MRRKASLNKNQSFPKDNNKKILQNPKNLKLQKYQIRKLKKNLMPKALQLLI